MTEIHQFTVVDPAAKIGANVKIGPFCAIGPEVQLGDGCILYNNVTLTGRTRIGDHNVFYQNVVVGETPQDLKYRGQPTETIVGPRNVFRENVTIHRGTELGGGKTVIGEGNLIMASAHIAHDCILGSGILLGNASLLAGHVTIEDQAVISALVGIHHFVTIGRFSFVGGLTPVRRDVPPYVKFSGDPNEVRGLNEEGLRRRGLDETEIQALRDAYRELYRRGATLTAALDAIEAQPNRTEHVRYLCDFLRRSLTGRFGRFQETNRQDSRQDRSYRRPAEVREDQ